MMPTRMTRLLRALPLLLVLVATAIVVSACGTQNVHIPSSDPDYHQDYAAAKIFSERCGGCHTLSYAGTSGSGQNPRDYEDINGPNFNVRCERPAIRVLYAIENGGFSGAYMPQNVVVGQQAREVAMFVSRFAGRQAPLEPGAAPCSTQSIGTLPALGSGTSTSSQAAIAVTTATTAITTTPTTSTNATTGAQTLQLSANASGQLMFSTNTLTAKAGKVTIVFTNQSPLGHNLTVQVGTSGKVLGHTPTFRGGSRSLTLTLKAGTYTYYCSVPGHRQAGMHGTLTVS